jgi:hypothetical protein
MPRKFQSILFWFDGSFSESVASSTLRFLRPEISGAEKITLLEKLQSLQQDLAIGKLEADVFCQKAIELARASTTPEQLSARLQGNVELNIGFFDIYSQIAAENDPRVIVDIPEAWFTALIQHWGVAASFPASRLIFTEQFKLDRMLPDIAYYLPRAVGRSMEDCILVDPLQMRAVALHKLGLVSTAFVYPRRLKIDLALQGIWKTNEDVYHPKAGARTNI